MSTRPASTRTLADYLTTGYWQDKGLSPHDFNSHVVTVNLTGLTMAGRILAREALEAWERVADIRFEERTGGADITFDDNQAGAETSASMSGSTTVSAHVNIGTDWLAKYGSGIGSYSFQTYIHEIGHALGLGHPATYSGGATYSSARFSSDSWQSTVMSYLDQDENPTVAANKAYVVTPMMADIMAIQDLYGRPQGGPSAGATIYRNGQAGNLARNAMTIFDVGGTDTIDLGGDRTAQQVDLGGGSFSSVHGLRGNLGIAVGTVIENYVAGAGNDHVAGNRAGNAIWLNGGSDTALGLGGSDRISGGGGSDHLRGGRGADWLMGGSARDRLDGGEGDDRLAGGLGADSFVFSAGHDRIDGFRSGQDRLLFDDRLWGGGALSDARILAFAHVAKGDIVFDFGGGDTLRIEGRTNIAALADDLAII